MKKLSLLFILFCTLNVVSQTGTIRVKKVDSPPVDTLQKCKFMLIAHNSLMNNGYRLSKFVIRGVNKKSAEDFRKKIPYTRGTLIEVREDFIENQLIEACGSKKYTIDKVEVTQTDQESVGGYVTVHFTLAPKKK